MKTTKVSDLLRKTSSSIKLSDVCGTGTYPVYGAQGIVGYLDSYQTPREALSVIKDGAGVGRVGRIPEKSSVLSTLQILTPVSNVCDLTYGYYLLKSLNLGVDSVGATIPHIYFKDYGERTIPERDIDEQRKISRTLFHIESEIKLSESQISYCAELIKSRFIEMFDDCDLHDQKERWVKLDDVTTIYTGTTPSTANSENWGGDILWVTPAEIKDDDFIISTTERTITEVGRRSKSLEIMPRGTVLLSTRAPIGKVAIAGNPMTCNQGFKNFLCGDRLNNVYLYYLLRYNNEFLNSIGTGTTFKEVSRSKIANVKIPVPPIDLQNVFASFVEKVDKLKFNAQERIKLYQELLNKKMYEYFG